MTIYSQRTKKSFAYRFLSAFVAFTFSFSYIVPPSSLYAQGIPTTFMNLPVPGTPVLLTPGFTPTRIIGMTIHADNPLMFDFMVDPGDMTLNDQQMQDESLKLVKYFLASLTVPAEKLWVNLSPYEKDKIVPKEFGQTEMGAELLAQDYMLKQLTASLMNPEDELGKKFWDRVYAKAQKMFGTTEIPLNTFNKVWIVPEKAVVYANGLNVFVLESRFKVMMEEDYLALQHHSAENAGSSKDVISGVSSAVIKEVLLPEIEKEVNEGKTFANLRQIHNSLILATWYKQNLKESLLGQVYADKAKTGGLTVTDKETSQKIYNQYVEAFEKGVYNFIKEDYDPATKEIIPRKYFSGGVTEAGLQVEKRSPQPEVLLALAKTADDASVITAGIKSPGGEISYDNTSFVKEATPPASDGSASSPVAKTGLSEAVGIAAQRITTAAKANTGELNIDAATRAGANGALAGHSEARENLGDADEMVNEQLRAAHTRNLEHILFAFGEKLEVRKKGGEKEFVKTQIEKGLRGLAADQVAKTIFAYEPIWAIGIGETATPQQAQEMAKFVRDTVESLYGKEIADKITILYGGSVTPETAAALIAQKDIDGFLVGGASNEYDSFTSILETVEAQGPKKGRVPYVGGNHKTKKIKTGYYSELSEFFKTLDTSRVRVSVLPSVGLITEAAQAMASSPVQELSENTPAEVFQNVIDRIKSIPTAEIFTRYADQLPKAKALAATVQYSPRLGNGYSVQFAGATLIDKYGHLDYPTIHSISGHSAIYFSDNAIYLAIYGTGTNDVLKFQGSARPAEEARRAEFFVKRMTWQDFEAEKSASSPVSVLDRTITEDWSLFQDPRAGKVYRDEVERILAHPDFTDEDPRVLANMEAFYRNSHSVLNGTGQLVILPIDQKLEHDAFRSHLSNPDGADAWWQPEFAYKLKMDGYAAPYGTIKMIAPKWAKHLPLIAKINNSVTSQAGATKEDMQSAMTSNIAELAALGVRAIGFTVYAGSSKFDEQIEELKMAAAEAKKHGLAVVVWSYPRGGRPEAIPTGHETSFDVTVAAVKVVRDIANIIKVKAPTAEFRDPAKKAEIEAQPWFEELRANGFDWNKQDDRMKLLNLLTDGRVQIFSGGPERPDVLTEIKELIWGGAGGNIIGRNSFKPQFHNPNIAPEKTGRGFVLRAQSLNMAKARGLQNYANIGGFERYAYDVILPQREAETPLELKNYGPEFDINNQPLHRTYPDEVARMLDQEFASEDPAVNSIANPNLLKNLKRIYRSGTLAGTGKLIIAPYVPGQEMGGISAYTVPAESAEIEVAAATLVPVIAKITPTEYSTGSKASDYSNPPILAKIERLSNLGVAAVSYELNIDSGLKYNAQMTELRAIINEAQKYGLPTVVQAYPTGSKQNALDRTTAAAAIAFDAGAHIIIIRQPSGEIYDEKNVLKELMNKNYGVPYSTASQQMGLVKKFALSNGRRNAVVTVSEGEDLLRNVAAILLGGGDGVNLDQVQSPQTVKQILAMIKASAEGVNTEEGLLAAASSPMAEGEQPSVFYFSTYDPSIDSQLPKGDITNKALLGGKGAGLADMAKKISGQVQAYKAWLKDKKGLTEAQMAKRRVTIPRVPLGYTITTDQTRHWKQRRDRGEDGISPELREDMMESMARLEKASGKKLGDTEGMPLLVAVRSGAKESMPGMMDTILNLGLNDRSVLALANASNEKFAWDTYRRFIGMYGSIILGVKDDEVAHTGFTAILEHMIKERGVKDETQLSAEDYKELVRLFKEEIQRQGKGLIPEDPYEQYFEAVETVMRSTFTERSMVYRAQQRLKLDDTISAVNVVEMIYGNRNGKSGTGVAFTRDVATGEKKFNLAVAFEAQGEDVVKGRKDGVAFEVMQTQAPDVAETISLFGEFLEEAYGDVQDMEFTFEHDENANTTNVYMLQTRNAKRTSQAEVRIAVEMFDEGRITKEIAVKRVNAGKLGELLASRFDPAEKTKAVATRALLSDGGLNASPGAGVGIIALDADTAKAEDQRIKAIQERIRRDEPVTDQERQIAKVDGVVLVREETSPDDLGGMVVSKAIATSRGGRTSHAAVVARQFGIPAVVGDKNMVIDFVNRTVTFTRVDGSRETLKEGDVISIDGSGDGEKGQVFKGKIGTKPSMIITAQNIESLDKVKAVITLLQEWMNQLTGANAEILRSEYSQHIKDYLSYINEYKDKQLTVEEAGFYRQYKKLLGWASELRKEKRGLGVGANAERPLDVLNAVLNGAERFGLVRTEHMFSGAGRELKFQRMILAKNQEARIAALNQLLPQQQADFEQIFLFADGRPVTIRLIDPPLHEFLPKEPAKIRELADSLGLSVTEVIRKINALKEENPMFGMRGARLSIEFPEIIEMQVDAIFNAMKKVQSSRIEVHPEIMVPLVGNVREFDFVKSRIENIARRQRIERSGFKIGTMIEIVAAGMNAAQIAKEAEFLSFGTNDYTQGGLKISRDDGKEYLENGKQAGVFTDDPFVTLDPGVALFIKRTVEAARAVNQAIKIGICGEQGVDPTSISRYLAPYGLNYVSGGSLRLPGALLAAAHEALKGHAPLEGKIRTEKPVQKRLSERVASIADAQTFNDQLRAAVDYVESNGTSVAAQRTALANLDLAKEMDVEVKKNPDFIKVHSWAYELLKGNNLEKMGVKVKIGADVNLSRELIPYNGLGMMTTEEYFLGDDNPIRRLIQAYLLEKDSANRSQLLSEIKEAVQRSFLENSGDETLTRRTFTVRLPNIALQDIFHYQNDKAFHEAMWSLSQQLGISAEDVRERIAKYHESNSAMGQRGSRIFFTEVAPLYTTIVAAIAQAAVKKEYSSLDFILPFTVNRNEIEVIRSGYADNRGKAVVPSLDQVLKEGRETMAINVGAEIETPAAAATAADIAKAVDGGPVVIDSKKLTEAVWAAFESDVRGAFLGTYMREGIWEQDPYKITPADTRLLIQEAIGAIKARAWNQQIDLVVNPNDVKLIAMAQQAGVSNLIVDRADAQLATIAAAQAAITIPVLVENGTVKVEGRKKPGAASSPVTREQVEARVLRVIDNVLHFSDDQKIMAMDLEYDDGVETGDFISILNRIEAEFKVSLSEMTNFEFSAVVDYIYEKLMLADAQISSSALTVEKPKETGGIDLNPGNMDLQTNYGGERIYLPMPNIPMENIKIDGLVPIIIHIAPVANLPFLLGLSSETEADGTAQYRLQPSPVDVPRKFKAREVEEIGLLN